MKHPVEHLRFPESTVEAVTEFRQITGQVLWTDPMMHTTNIALDIADQGMDPGQDLRSLLSRTGHQPLMVVLGRTIQKAIPLPTGGFNHRFLNQTLPYQGLNLFAINSGNHAHGGKSGLISRSFHGYHHFWPCQQHLCRAFRAWEPRSKCRPSQSSPRSYSKHPGQPWLCESCGP